MADQIVSEAIAHDPTVKNVDPQLAKQILSESVGQQLDRLELTSREVRVLKEVAQRSSVRRKEYQELGFQNAPHFIQGALQPLQEKGLLSEATQGNAAVYALRPLAILCYHFDLLTQSKKGTSPLVHDGHRQRFRAAEGSSFSARSFPVGEERRLAHSE